MFITIMEAEKDIGRYAMMLYPSQTQVRSFSDILPPTRRASRFSAAVRTTRASIFFAVARPGLRRALPSYLAAMSSRCQFQ